MTPVISIVIPTYNRAADLARALASVRAQTYGDWEAVVVDNQSTDHTHDVIRELDDPRVRLLAIANEGVIAASRNKGIAHAQGAFVAFLDSDDAWAPDKLERALFWLERGNDVVYHDMQVVPTTRFYFGTRTFATRQLVTPVYEDLLINGNTLPTSSVVVRRSLLVEVGGFTEEREMIAGEDVDLWLRLAQRTEGFKRLHGTLGQLGRGVDNASGSRRLLGVLRLLEERYISRLPAEKRAQAYSQWLDYAYARAQYEQKHYDVARDYLVKVVATSTRWSFRAKALYMLLASTALRASGSNS
jgi:glycosyltransferase involved in cell wall biosynthesis